MVSRLKTLISTLLALVFCIQLLASPALAGLNLCIGHDGHIELEADDGNCCPPTSNGLEVSIAQQAGVCISCIDVSLGDEGADPQVAFKVQAPITFFALPNLLGHLKTFQPAPSAHLDRPSASPQTLMAIQTIVLRV